MSVSCNKCGTTNIDTASFCKECGNNLTEQKRLGEEARNKARAEAENRRQQEETESRLKKAEDEARAKAKADEAKQQREADEAKEQASSYSNSTLTAEQKVQATYNKKMGNSNGRDENSDPALQLSKAIIIVFIFVSIIILITATSLNSNNKTNGIDQSNLNATTIENVMSLWNEKTGFSNVDLAIKYLNEIILNQPSAIAYNLRGIAYSQIGNNNYSVDDFAQAVKLQPDDKVLHVNLGNEYLKIGNTSKAKISAERACELGDCNLLNQINSQQTDNKKIVNTKKSTNPSKKAKDTCSFWLDPPGNRAEYESCIRDIDGR